MNLTLLECRTTSFNAKVAAVSLAAAALMTLVLTHFSFSLAPLRILALALAAFAAWAFCDEMGLKKPLNRAGFVFFIIAIITKVQIALGLSEQVIARYYLLYTAFLLLAIVLWSLAFLHRQRSLKIVGAVGLVASLLPIGIIILGHIVVGVGTAFGIGALVSVTNENSLSDLSFVTLVERIFGLWAYVAAWLLWRGHIRSSN